LCKFNFIPLPVSHFFRSETPLITFLPKCFIRLAAQRTGWNHLSLACKLALDCAQARGVCRRILKLPRAADFFLLCVCVCVWRRAPQQKLRTHRSLKAYCATLVTNMKRKIISFFHIFKEWSTGGMKLTGENRSTRGKNLSQCHSVHHKSHMDRPGTDSPY
jgi:hypothetical protein